jgi:hypothetical protein
MDRLEAPHADIAILLYLVCVTGVLALIIGALFWLMRPTVFPNPGVVSHKPRPQAFAFHMLATTSSKEMEMERTAIASAEQQNAEQGLASSSTPTVSRPAVVASVDAIEIVPPPRKPKKRRTAARVQKQQVSHWDFWQPWGNSQRSPRQAFWSAW